MRHSSGTPKDQPLIKSIFKRWEWWILFLELCKTLGFDDMNYTFDPKFSKIFSNNEVKSDINRKQAV